MLFTTVNLAVYVSHSNGCYSYINGYHAKCRDAALTVEVLINCCLFAT